MTKISDLSAMTGAAITDADDLITMVDASETGVAKNKKMTFAELALWLATKITGLLDFKGSTDCSANPNYPAASKGDYYLVSVAGKIGGASGTVVEAGDTYFATADNAGGTQASVGTSWTVVQGNIITDNDTALTADSASKVPTQHAVKSYVDTAVSGATGTYTDEKAQDAIGAMIDTSLTYVDATPLLQVNQANLKPTEHIQVACSDETTAITTGTAKVTFRMPYAFTVTDVRASVNTAPTGSTILIDINESGTTILSTKLMIDASEKTSTTAATPAVISDTSLADDAEITIDFDQVGSTIAGKGVKVILIGHRT